MLGLTALALAVLTIAAFVLSRARALTVAGDDLSSLHSRPVYHGAYVSAWTAIVGFGLLLLGTVLGGIITTYQLYSTVPESFSAIERDLIVSDGVALARNGLASRTDALREDIAALHNTLTTAQNWGLLIVSIAAALAVFWMLYKRIGVPERARNKFEQVVGWVLIISAAIAVLTTVGIVASLLGQTVTFFSGYSVDFSFAFPFIAFEKVSEGIPLTNFLFGTLWSPLAGVHEGAMDPGKVGAIPLFAGTLMITVIAMLVAVPIGLFAAIYLADFASPAARSVIKPVLEILAGIPTVVYGFFAAITVAPFIRDTGASIGLSVSSESALAAGIVMGIMIIPFISSLSDDVINAVPQSLRDGSYGLGATKAETIRNVILPAALPGIVSAILLGVSRAIGETMIVVMAAGQGANLTANPLEAVTTVTVQIVALITGDTEASTAAGPAFSLGFTLFCVTLIFNVWALRLVRKYREVYD